MINNNVNQFELLSQDQSKKDQFLSDLDNKSSLFADSLNETCKKLNKIEDFVTVNSHEVSTKFNELKTMFIGFNNSFKPEVQNSMNGVKELISKLEDQGSFLKEKVELLTIQQKKNSIEIEKNIQDIQKDFKVVNNIVSKEFISIYKLYILSFIRVSAIKIWILYIYIG